MRKSGRPLLILMLAVMTTGLIATLAILLSNDSASAASQGRIVALLPPGNDGSGHGAGQIEETDANGNGQGKPYLVFRMPQDLDQSSVPLIEGDAVTFDIARGQTATNVSKSIALPTCSLEASPAVIFSGDSTTLTWETTNADSASISNGIGAVAVPSGQEVVTPNVTTTFTLTATNSVGSCDQSVLVSVE